MIRINLLPVRAEKRKENVRKQGVLIIAYVLVLLIVLVGVQLSQISLADGKKRVIEKQRADIVKLDQTIREVQNYNAKLTDLTDKLNVVIGLERKQRGPAKVFGELSKVTPEKIWIEKLSDNGGLITIDGWAIDQQTIAQFMMNLEASPLFERVKLKITKKAVKSGADLQSFIIETNVTAPPAPTPVKAAGKAG